MRVCFFKRQNDGSAFIKTMPREENAINTCPNARQNDGSAFIKTMPLGDEFRCILSLPNSCIVEIKTASCLHKGLKYQRFTFPNKTFFRKSENIEKEIARLFAGFLFSFRIRIY